jgi:uncharacterized protein YyaL (SSP411 family)
MFPIALIYTQSGGFLAAYYLSSLPIYLEKSVELGNKIIACIYPATGLTSPRINLHNPQPDNEATASTLADVGSLSLELKYLSHLTNDYKYRQVADRINQYLSNQTESGGMLRKALK